MQRRGVSFTHSPTPTPPYAGSHTSAWRAQDTGEDDKIEKWIGAPLMCHVRITINSETDVPWFLPYDPSPAAGDLLR